MRWPRLRRPSAATVIALLALFVALGSTGLAAPVVERAKRLITGKQIKNGSLEAKDLSRKARRSLRGLPGRRGDDGPQGAPGPPGSVARVRASFAGSFATPNHSPPAAIRRACRRARTSR